MPNYQDFLNAMNKHGLSGQFSSYDMELAQKNPSAGLSLVTIKNNYANATTDEQKAMYNQMANDIRKQYGSYTAGSDGSGYIAVGGPSPNDFNYGIQRPGDFNYGISAPTWESPYTQEIEDLLGQVKDYGDFTYDVSKDPLYSQYRKQYLREGQRATADTLGQMAAMNGGQVSSSASMAASQAGDYYASQLSDKVPELEQYAYGKWQDGYNQLLTALQAAQNREESEYSKYLNQYDQWLQGYNNAYNEYLNNQNMWQQGYNDAYQQYLDELDWQNNKELQDYEKELLSQQNNTTARDEAREQVDAILQAGGTISDALLQQAQYDPSYITALQEYYKQQAIQAAQKASSGGGNDSSDSPAGYDYAGLFAAAEKSGYPKSYIMNNYKDYGFTSSSGLYDEFEEYLGMSDTMTDPYYRAFANSVAATLQSGQNNKEDIIKKRLDDIWGSLKQRQPVT